MGDGFGTCDVKRKEREAVNHMHRLRAEGDRFTDQHTSASETISGDMALSILSIMDLFLLDLLHHRPNKLKTN